MEDAEQSAEVCGESTKPRQDEIERFTLLYQSFLASASEGNTAQWEQYQRQIPARQKSFFDDVQQKIRSEFHSQRALNRRQKLSSLLLLTPPFSQSVQDVHFSKSRKGQKQRYSQVEQFIRRFCTRSLVGAHPFFASLKRLLEYQGSGLLDRSCQWLLDDAVLMESGGDDWLESVVWILKGVLHFEEKGAATVNDPVVGETESLRWWTVDPSLSDLECSSLAGLVPSYVIPRRGKGALAVQRIAGDEENQIDVELPTGSLRLSDTLRDGDHRGSLMDRLWAWLLARWY